MQQLQMFHFTRELINLISFYYFFLSALVVMLDHSEVCAKTAVLETVKGRILPLNQNFTIL